MKQYSGIVPRKFLLTTFKIVPEFLNRITEISSFHSIKQKNFLVVQHKLEQIRNSFLWESSRNSMHYTELNSGLFHLRSGFFPGITEYRGNNEVLKNIKKYLFFIIYT